MGPGLRIRRPQRLGRSVQLRSAGIRSQLRARELRARHQRGADRGGQADHRAGRETRAVPGGRRETGPVSRSRRETRAGAHRQAGTLSRQSAGENPCRAPRAISRVRAKACARLHQGTPRTRLR